MGTALWPLQQAIFQRLSNDSELNNLIEGVYDYVLEDTSFPYVTIGEPTVSPQFNKSSYWEEIPWTHHVWSQSMGKKESYDIMNQMHNALTQSALELEGGFFVQMVNTEQMQVMTDIDNQTYHGIMRVRYVIRQ